METFGSCCCAAVLGAEIGTARLSLLSFCLTGSEAIVAGVSKDISSSSMVTHQNGSAVHRLLIMCGSVVISVAISCSYLARAVDTLVVGSRLGLELGASESTSLFGEAAQKHTHVRHIQSKKSQLRLIVGIRTCVQRAAPPSASSPPQVRPGFDTNFLAMQMSQRANGSRSVNPDHCSC